MERERKQGTQVSLGEGRRAESGVKAARSGRGLFAAHLALHLKRGVLPLQLLHLRLVFGVALAHVLNKVCGLVENLGPGDLGSGVEDGAELVGPRVGSVARSPTHGGAPLAVRFKCGAPSRRRSSR